MVDLDPGNNSGEPGVNYLTSFTGAAVFIAARDTAFANNGDLFQLASLQVTIVAPPDGSQETLTGYTAAATASGITGTLATSDGNEVLTLSGSATISQYLAVLKSIQYDDVSASPSPGVRTITVQATGGSDFAFGDQAPGNIAMTFVSVSPSALATTNSVPAAVASAAPATTVSFAAAMLSASESNAIVDTAIPAASAPAASPLEPMKVADSAFPNAASAVPLSTMSPLASPAAVPKDAMISVAPINSSSAAIASHVAADFVHDDLSASQTSAMASAIVSNAHDLATARGGANLPVPGGSAGAISSPSVLQAVWSDEWGIADLSTLPEDLADDELTVANEAEVSAWLDAINPTTGTRTFDEALFS
ncbi:MAG TPA: hypothetical protein VHV08_04270 [Pirellulales bacterium]|nr:hypothetical protein [Pirellulales bacterium]